MNRNLLPDLLAENLYAVPLDALWQRGVRCLVLDLDNTLMPWNAREYDEKLPAWLENARQMGFALFMLSNGTGPRVQEMAGLAASPMPASPGPPASKPRPGVPAFPASAAPPSAIRSLRISWAQTGQAFIPSWWNRCPAGNSYLPNLLAWWNGPYVGGCEIG